jgi:hypothetical protein
MSVLAHRVPTEEPVPRARWAQAIAQGHAAPLPPALRRSLESRLAADLGDVRIHTGAAAARLCSALGARALTWGHDILFADGAYAPHSASGLRLLAHEIVHVLQQRAAAARPARGASTGVIAVGCAGDACEDEADRLAARLVRGGACRGVTPDARDAIRRAISTLDSTAEMSVSATNTSPGLDYVQRGSSDYGRMAVLHLSRNKGPILRGRIASPAHASAIRITGTVSVLASPTDTAADIRRSWSFHFVQLFFDMLERAAYAGQTAADGSISLNLAGPQYYRGYQKFLIDADPDAPDTMPYADTWTGLEAVNPMMGLWKATVILDDHPFADRPLLLLNPKAGNKRNYLYDVVRQFEVITVLVAVDQGTGTIKPLVHFDWGSMYSARLRWQIDGSGTISVGPPRVTTSYFRLGAARAGAPTGRGLAALVTGAASATTSDTYLSAIGDAFSGVLKSVDNGLDVEQTPRWSSSVPPDHFK